MELKRSKNPDVCYIFTKGYIRAKGYGDEQAIPYIKIPDIVANWEEPMKSELMAIYEQRYPICNCAVCGKEFRRTRAKITCGPECSHKYTNMLLKERGREDVEVECSVCGKLFKKKRNQQKYTCSRECTKEFGKAHDGKIDRTNKKHNSQLVKIEKDARKKGLHYADIQKQKTLAMVGGIEI